MRTSPAWVFVPLLAACMSTERVTTDTSARMSAHSVAARRAALNSAPPPPIATPAPVAGGQIGDSYTKVRVGAFDPTGDISGLDNGIWADVAFGRRFFELVSIQASLGYFDASGDAGAELYGVPLMIDARLGVPIAIVEPYAGGGVGGVWASSEASGFASEDGFAGMWNAFVGLELGLGGFALGAEYRYVQSGDLDAPGGGNYQLEGNVFSVSGTLPF